MPSSHCHGLLAAVAGLTLFAGPTQAGIGRAKTFNTGQTRSGRNHGSTNGNGLANTTGQSHTGVMTELHQAHRLLNQADHDYQGHRAKAEHEVGTAIRELAGQHHHNGTANRATGTGTNSHVALQGAGGRAGNGAATGQQRAGQNQKMPQAASDANLKQAAQLLTTALGKMPSGHKAATNVQLAINEIHTALGIK